MFHKMFEISFHIAFFLILRVKGHLDDLLIYDYYLQRVTLRWVLPPEGDIEMTTEEYWESINIY